MPTLLNQELYLSAFNRLGAKLPGQDAAWLGALRLEALDEFGRIGFPSDKSSEVWKYTDLSLSLLKIPFTLEAQVVKASAVAGRLKQAGFEVEKAHLMVFVNGRFTPEWSSLKPLPPGVTVQNLASSLLDGTVKASVGKTAGYQGRAFTAINTAYFTDGLFARLAPGKILDIPIHAVYLSVNGNQNTQSHTRNLLSLGDDSKAQVIEHYWGENAGAYFTNAVTEAVLAKGSYLDHTKIVQEDPQGYHIGSLTVRQEEGSRLTSRVFSVGGAFIWNEVETALSAKKAECFLEGLYLAKDKQHVDTRTFIDHLSPDCASHEAYKGVLDGQATGIFDGRILVRENAQKTDARQSNKNLLLSGEAKVYSKPQLQIYADDVKCSHGSATGQLDKEALFYLRSRGIGLEEARRILVYAFAGEMVEKIESDYSRPAVARLVDRWMEGSR
jgi:Fe-S cluster assembly protein SufD